jgi:hypothetical protein
VRVACFLVFVGILGGTIPGEGILSIITLTTDFGLKDGNVGVIKGVIWGICPEARIADLSHMIGPQNIAEAALLIFRSAPYFPPGSIHVVIVDPGVGTARRPMAARLGGWYYVGPDNGTITLLLERAEQEGLGREFFHLDRPEYWLREVSHVFHGRDVFAPVAAYLARGVPLRELGTPVDDPLRLELPRPERTSNGWRGEVIHIDHFGNVASNIRVEHLDKALDNKANLGVRMGGIEIRGLVDTFGERAPGELIALFGSTGNLIVSVVNGSAAARLGIKIGDSLDVIFQPNC